MNTMLELISKDVARVANTTQGAMREYLKSVFYDVENMTIEDGDILITYDNGDSDWYEYDEFIEDIARAYNDDKLAKQCNAIAVYPKNMVVNKDRTVHYYTGYRIELAYIEIGEVDEKGHIEFKASVLDDYTTRQLMAFTNRILDLLQEVR